MITSLVLKSVLITFEPEGLEVAMSYEHSEVGYRNPSQQDTHHESREDGSCGLRSYSPKSSRSHTPTSGGFGTCTLSETPRSL